MPGFTNNNGKKRLFYRLTKLHKDAQGNDAVSILCGPKEAPMIYNSLGSVLVDVQSFEGEYEGKPTNRIRFIFEDDEYSEWFECGRYTGFTRDVLNCLASVDKISHVKLTPFISEDKETGNKYVRGSVRVGENFETKLTKCFKNEEIPKIKMVQVGKRQEKDDLDLCDWTDHLVTEIKSKIVKVPTSSMVSEAPPTAEDDSDVF